MINTTIGKYKITRLIGEGGMASVYEAVHEMLGTKVAIKVLNPILSANAQIKERFRNEAKLMASLDHQNITKVIDFDEQPQQLSIVMEFLNGEDLNQKIKRNGPLSEKEITDVFSQTLSAFQYAHEKGIVHRDIKPSNIFILPNGHVKILDFGIAKLFGQGNEMTQTGTQMGTPIYMSPEQVKADKSIDHRSDIYSLGVTMFYAINGKPPYNSDTDSQFDIFTKIVYEPLPEFSIQSKFQDLVLKACNKNREDRFQSCIKWLNFITQSKSTCLDSEKTKIDDSNAKYEKTILDEDSNSSRQNIEESNFPNKVKNKNNTRRSIFILTALVLLVLGIYGGFNLRNKTIEQINDNVSSADNFKADTTSKANSSEHNNVNESIQEKSNSDEIVWNNSTDGTYTDPRDRKEYKIVKIGNQIWMAENLAYKSKKGFYPAQGSVYGYNESYGDCPECGSLNAGSTFNKIRGEEYNRVYGGLYTWESAKLSCPPGWHLPSKTEWQELINVHGGLQSAREISKGIGQFSSWGDWNKLSNNKFGFGAIPGGRLELNDNMLNYVAGFAFYWTSSESSNSNAFAVNFDHFSNMIEMRTRSKKSYAMSVRCIKD
jgi:uncharacterized protein (TIGR02145 family)